MPHPCHDSRPAPARPAQSVPRVRNSGRARAARGPLAAAAAVVLACACASQSSRAHPAEDEAHAQRDVVSQAPTAAWPQVFRKPAVLVAREVSIEGPPGLVQHAALTFDSSVHEYSTKTLPEGLLQEVRVKPGSEGALVRCQLDSLQIAAEQRVRVLERPGPVALVVTASGDAYWSTPDGEEKRGDTLRLEGQGAP